MNEILKHTLLEQLVAKLKELLVVLTAQPQPPMNPLYTAAVKHLGTDASPLDLVSDSYGCAETVSTIIREVVGGFPIVTGTWSLYDALNAHYRFSRVGVSEIPTEGDILVCVTGWRGSGKNGVTNGHAWILGKNGVAMSNNSATGLFEENYTLKSIDDRYVKKGGYPVFVFRLR